MGTHLMLASKFGFDQQSGRLQSRHAFFKLSKISCSTLTQLFELCRSSGHQICTEAAPARFQKVRLLTQRD